MREASRSNREMQGGREEDRESIFVPWAFVVRCLPLLNRRSPFAIPLCHPLLLFVVTTRHFRGFVSSVVQILCALPQRPVNMHHIRVERILQPAIPGLNSAAFAKHEDGGLDAR